MGRPVGFEPTHAGATIRCVNHFATTAMNVNGRGSRNRTHIKGFGDLRFTIKLYPCVVTYIILTGNGGGGQIRTAEP